MRHITTAYVPPGFLGLILAALRQDVADRQRPRPESHEERDWLTNSGKAPRSIRESER